MSDVDLVEAVKVLRDEVLDTAERGDRDAAGAEVFDAIVRALVIGAGSGPDLDLQLHDAVRRRLAWGDSEESVLSDAEMVFDRVMVAIERAFRDPADRLVLVEAATQVAVTVARVVSLAALGRVSRDRGARLREEFAQRQLKDVLEKQRSSIVRLEFETKPSSD
jgi:hypothetical protein